MTTDRPFVGILFMLAFCVLAPFGDSIAKLLGASVSLMTLVFVRFFVQTAVLLPMSVVQGESLRLPKGLSRWVLLRTVLHILGIGTMFTALQYLPLADALAIAFVMPFIMLLLGRFVMGEEVGIARLMACAIGFGGTLLVIQPNFAEVGAPALLPLGVAVIFALFMMATRQVAKQINPITLQAISGLQASAILLAVAFLASGNATAIDLAFDRTTGLLLLSLGLLGTAAHLFMTWSLKLAPASTLAPMQYLEIPFGTAIGWLVFADLPNGLAALGICITIGAGLYVIFRERRLSLRQAMPPAEL